MSCFNSFAAIPEEVRTECGLDAESFDKEKLRISISNSGPKMPKSFQRVYCEFCQTNILPHLLEAHKSSLGENKNLQNLIDKWDDLKITKVPTDVIGCFLPYDEKHIAGPNVRRFIQRPCEHTSSAHAFTQASTASTKKAEKQVNRFKTTLKKDLGPDVAVVKKVLTLEKSPSQISKAKTVTITGKYNHKMKFQHVGAKMDQKVGIHEESRDALDRFSKGFCFSIIHVGINKCLSNNAIIENYQKAIEGKFYLCI